MSQNTRPAFTPSPSPAKSKASTPAALKSSTPVSAPGPALDSFPLQLPPSSSRLAPVSKLDIKSAHDGTKIRQAENKKELEERMQSKTLVKSPNTKPGSKARQEYDQLQKKEALRKIKDEQEEKKRLQALTGKESDERITVPEDDVTLAVLPPRYAESDGETSSPTTKVGAEPTVGCSKTNESSLKRKAISGEKDTVKKMRKAAEKSADKKVTQGRTEKLQANNLLGPLDGVVPGSSE